MSDNDQSGTGAAQTTEQTSEAAAPDQLLLPEHKNQLRQRVEARTDELAAALAQLAKDAEHEQRARDIVTALEGAKDATAGGWERVGQMEASRLSQWLESTKHLGVLSSPPVEALEAQVASKPQDDA